MQREMKTFQEHLRESMKDPEFAKAWDELQPERAVMRVIIEAREARGLSQKEVAERTGIAQTEISKLERGKRNPSIKLLQRLADGLGYTLRIEFVPKSGT